MPEMKNPSYVGNRPNYVLVLAQPFGAICSIAVFDDRKAAEKTAVQFLRPPARTRIQWIQSEAGEFYYATVSSGRTALIAPRALVWHKPLTSMDVSGEPRFFFEGQEVEDCGDLHAEG